MGNIFWKGWSINYIILHLLLCIITLLVCLHCFHFLVCTSQFYPKIKSERDVHFMNSLVNLMAPYIDLGLWYSLTHAILEMLHTCINSCTQLWSFRPHYHSKKHSIFLVHEAANWSSSTSRKVESVTYFWELDRVNTEENVDKQCSFQTHMYHWHSLMQYLALICFMLQFESDPVNNDYLKGAHMINLSVALCAAKKHQL